MAVPSVTPASMKGERVAFTGRLASTSRRSAYELLRAAGGRLDQSLTRATTMLVVGMKGWPLRKTGQLSNKLRIAEEMIKDRSKLRIVSEEQFLEKVGLRHERPAVRKSLRSDQVCQLVGVSEDVLLRWEAIGLVRSHEGCFDFQDLVSLQTIAALVADGADPHTIAVSVRSLSRVLPDTDRPLAQLKLLTQHDRLAAEVNGSLIDSTGQLLMRFEHETDEAPPPALSLPAPRTIPHRSADELFALASEQEEYGDLEAAASLYRETLSVQPLFPEANFNLANILRSLNRPHAAEERLRIALEQDPGMAAAWYNLADLLDEQGDFNGAIECLRHAVSIDADYGDAHYNLAVHCEQAGLDEEAKQHWREYLRVDSSSEWAAFARRRLSG